MKRRYLFGMIIVIALYVLGCGNSAQNISQAVEQQKEEAEEKAPESTPNPTPKPKPTPTPSQEEIYGESYEYILYSGKFGSAPILGFNCSYKPVSHKCTGGPDHYRYIGFETNEGEFLSLSSGEYKINQEGHLVDSSDYGVGRVEEQEEIDTIYGKAKLFLRKTKEEWEYQSDVRGEVAQLDIENDTVIVWYDYPVSRDAHGNFLFPNTEYQGILKKLLPELFKAVSAKKTEWAFDENNIAVPADLYEMEICDSYEGYDLKSLGYRYREMKPVFGINMLEGWRENGYNGRTYNPDKGEYTRCTGYEMARDLQKDYIKDNFLRITTAPDFFNLFFGGRSPYTLEEKAEVETPFGTARVFHATRNDTEAPSEEEVAVLNNLGTNIVINYWETSDNYDGVYDGKLEELVPELFK